MSKTEVVVLKLSSGEEIIAYQEGMSDALLSISKPRVIIVGQTNPQGQVGLQMFPWVLSCADAKVDINRDLILGTVSERDLPKEMVDGYISRTTSIQVAGADSLIKVK